jgi:hypothetical protein
MSYRSQGATFLAESAVPYMTASGPVNPYPTPAKSSSAWDWIKGIGGKVMGTYAEQQAAAAKASVYEAELARRAQAGQRPAWLVPAGIIGGAVLLAVLLRRKRD